MTTPELIIATVEAAEKRWPGTVASVDLQPAGDTWHGWVVLLLDDDSQETRCFGYGQTLDEMLAELLGNVRQGSE